ncbi:hypothetical protein NLJ89_g8327 [Agrocybe chaxingu]|uniref:Cytochrome P450 n=1 Tax=Agrocybe chaxingu TaxID=84603 RepID=A0A9W8JVG5_9AGAR|nr:hypothetical protein NLJ89_g8327 [Agrocybe chaxingu]
MPRLLTILDVALFVLGVFLVNRFVKRKSAPLPPGPRKLPLLENLLDMPTTHEWLKFAEWGEKWGDIVSVSVLGQPIIIVNSAKAAMEMLDKKSLIYSDRSEVVMGGELVGWKDALVMLPYGERLRKYRRMLHHVVGTPAAVSEFHQVEEKETRHFLKLVLAEPDLLAEHIRRTAGAIILRIAFGYDIQENHDPFVKLADEATEQFSLSTAPGGFLVNLVPPLRYLPSWFPGAGFKKTAKLWWETLNAMTNNPYEWVKEHMKNGTAEVSFVSRLLEAEGADLTPEREHEIKWSAASLYSGGADTTVSSIYAFFLAMVLFPEVMRKAQQELDAVVGLDRLPTFSDRERLPYVNALTSEVLRWHTVAPTGDSFSSRLSPSIDTEHDAAPHSVMEDNIQNGYLIPKGAIVIPNVWQMAHDPKVYSDPFTFKPERFLGSHPEPDPREVCFGFGRRICPGRILADASIFLSCAMSLAVFDISKSTEDHTSFTSPHEQTTGIIR